MVKGAHTGLSFPICKRHTRLETWALSEAGVEGQYLAILEALRGWRPLRDEVYVTLDTLHIGRHCKPLSVLGPDNKKQKCRVSSAKENSSTCYWLCLELVTRSPKACAFSPSRHSLEGLSPPHSHM
jgi:hypothetical protein